MMLTTDVALATDPEYRKYMEEFANDTEAFTREFAKVWYKLVTRDMGPRSRCVGPRVPEAQPFQNPLPEPPKKLANMKKVAKQLKKVIKDNPEGEFVRLAWQCASTYRATDYQGGCNGASIRFPPGSEWPANKGLNKTLEMLKPVKEKFGEGLSWADTIVLAGNVAAEMAGAPSLPFCPGRTDASDGSAWAILEFGNKEPCASVDEMIMRYKNRGQTAREFVALTFPMFNSTRNLKSALESDVDGNVLLEGLKYYPELHTWANYYIAAGDKKYGEDFRLGWTRVMNADRFDGPVRNKCGL
jgi:catalase (peroxidase I)